MSTIFNIADQRQLLWDESLIDTKHTTAQLMLHRPTPREIVLEHNAPWEGDACIFHNILSDDDVYRMYYVAFQSPNPELSEHKPRPGFVCYAESKDGKFWTKPALGLREFEGSKENNILMDHTDFRVDNFFVFKDNNPNCPLSEKYKAIIGYDCQWWKDDKMIRRLVCYTSDDGIHFQYGWLMTDQGIFDTLNTAYWDLMTNEYVCYIRDFHNVPDGNLNKGIRDIRRMTSQDFKHWTTPELIDFSESEDIPLYTNVIQPYYRANDMWIGFPTRYVEKEEWTPNFDELSGVKKRKLRMKLNPRYGLAITDCVFMTSRNGIKWKRWDEAFLSPGLEHENNWVYGDCYPAVGLIETKNDITYLPDEISMYVNEFHGVYIPSILRRYTIRKDGFVSFHAKYESAQVVTKPLRYKGARLSINFATSAAGYIRFKIIGKSQVLHSYELFGDSLDRTVHFLDGDIATLMSEVVILEITMKDAHLYSMVFTDK